MASLIKASPPHGRVGLVSVVVRRTLVRRSELIERLSEVRPGGVVLVGAPAGSGKPLG